jgi:thioredoxin-like negative regulator of GroEL
MVGKLLLGAVLVWGPADPPLRDAQSLKQLGDEHVARDEVRQAADAYEQALALGRAEFSAAECIRMAVIISWDDRLKTAIRELKLVLNRDPINLDARVQLARIYSWNGQINQAVDEADAVLMVAPNDTETLLVKANALEWDDRFDEAIPIYRKVIDRDGDFAAHVGLASATLYKGDRAEAERLTKALTPTDDLEKRQFKRLSDAVARETRPRMQFGYDYYSDSDENHSGRYSARYVVPVGNHDFAVNLGRTSVGGESNEGADEALFEADFKASGPLGLAVGIGVARLRSEGTPTFPTGHLELHGRLHRTSLSATAMSEMLSETPQLVANRVRRLSAGVDVEQRITSRWSAGGAYTRMRFSDANQAYDAQARTEFAVVLAPRITVGYQVRRADYERQSRRGYFDPSDLVSHRVSASMDLDGRKVFAFLQIYGGHQKFVRNAFQTSEWAKGARASFGVRPTDRFEVEVNASAGDFAQGSVSGFRYFTAGSSVAYRF